MLNNTQVQIPRSTIIKIKIVIVVLLLFIGFVVGYMSQSQIVVDDKVVHIIDTVKIIQPSPTQVDTFYKEKIVHVKVVHSERDTLFRVDSVLVYLPYERKVYEDSTYRAVVSGYEPRLDEFEVYNKQTTVYIEKTPPMLSPYVTGGVGLNKDISIGAGVFIRDKDALGVEYGNRGLQFKYIHKF